MLDFDHISSKELHDPNQIVVFNVPARLVYLGFLYFRSISIEKFLSANENVYENENIFFRKNF